MASDQDVQNKVQGIIRQLREETWDMVPPASITLIEEYGRDPFLVLIACLLSLRTKDIISLPASCRLFSYAQAPQEILALPNKQIEELIYPVAFYRKRAQNLKDVSQELLDRFDGRVPSTTQELMSLPGVGLKTANLVLSMGFAIPALCVDTHVHRISNRFGLVITKTPEETERALKKVIPRNQWIEYCNLLVMWGQNVCSARGQKCKNYSLHEFCRC